MDEFQIAKSMAEILDRLKSGGGGDQGRRGSAELGREERELARLEGMTAELALRQARATNGDFKTAMVEASLGVSKELATIMAATVDPVVAGLRKASVEEGGGEVCGVCQEEMEVGDEDVKAMANCMHKFHGYCIFKWLKQKGVCPLCRALHVVNC
ncbi:E3 ubiquitin-protein ligase EL5-like [Diospyros lotus]|uniref:E3 ubiquitin-protein ligase EL5-like n=1 Tax=Diospyros lotus TaxID=55363 RepID=UPI00224F3BAC|nr:E3 ubiquitin-protein ligase EL5-like [Diospyros lotus]